MGDGEEEFSWRGSEEVSYSALSPVNFFQISADCLFAEPPFPRLTSASAKKYQLPDTSKLCSEVSFADVAIAWNSEGLELFCHINAEYQFSSYPEVMRGDSVEIFIDTRDVKTSGFNTRFCHHFFFFPKMIDGHQAGEITRFRTEDTHELCDPNELIVKSQMKKSQYSMQIFIPAQCLYGYDPEQFNRMGFTYRINRAEGPSQHFSVVTDEYQIEQQPSLWSSLKLVR